MLLDGSNEATCFVLLQYYSVCSSLTFLFLQLFNFFKLI